MPIPQRPVGANERKWGRTLLSGGWVAIPNVIIECQRELKLDPLDINILLHLASRWWRPEVKPQSTKGALAEAMGYTP